MAVQFHQNVRAIGINHGAHRFIARRRENFARALVMLKRFLVAIKAVVNYADVGFKLREMNRLAAREHSRRRARDSAALHRSAPSA